jgi:hypothetical protein
MAKKSDAPKPDFNPRTGKNDLPKPDFNSDEVRSMPIYHGSNMENPDQFMRAPAIHVGTQDQANQIIEDPDSRFEEGFTPKQTRWPIGRSFPGVHKLQFSQFAEFHPNVMEDKIVNIAHAMLLHKNKMHWDTGAIPTHYEEYKDHPQVQEALQALESNKIIPYHNVFEQPVDKFGRHTEHEANARLSYLVPSPRLNLKRGNRRDPQQQPVLPMDYSGVSETKTSQRHRENFKNQQEK